MFSTFITKMKTFGKRFSYIIEPADVMSTIN